MNKYIFIYVAFAVFFYALPSYAQKDTVINGIRYKAVPQKKPDVKANGKHLIPLDSQFVIDHKQFQYYNNWINIGIGAQQNLTYGISLGFAGSADVNFHIKRSYFQVGAMLTGERLRSYNNYQAHVCYGARFEDKDVHIAGFAGISYSSGNGRDSDSTYNRRYQHPGIYAEAEIVKKISYDIGLGGSLFGDWNKEQSMIGARFIMYFSAAFIGKEKTSGSENE